MGRHLGKRLLQAKPVGYDPKGVYPFLYRCKKYWAILGRSLIPRTLWSRYEFQRGARSLKCQVMSAKRNCTAPRRGNGGVIPACGKAIPLSALGIPGKDE